MYLDLGVGRFWRITKPHFHIKHSRFNSTARDERTKTEGHFRIQARTMCTQSVLALAALINPKVRLSEKITCFCDLKN